jgi:hypothetical protein
MKLGVEPIDHIQASGKVRATLRGPVLLVSVEPTTQHSVAGGHRVLIVHGQGVEYYCVVTGR